METLIIIFLIAAFVCFIIAAFGATWAWTARINLIALGLAFWVATLLLPHLK